VNDKYEDPMSGGTIFHNKRWVITNEKAKTKMKISLYHVLSDHRKERPELSTKTEFRQILWNDPE
jgi:hypothetical protein